MTKAQPRRRVSPGVAIEAARHVCAACGHDLGPEGAAWKDHARRREVPLAAAGGPAYDTGDDAVVLRHFCCPGCAVLLDTETAMQGDPPLVDRLA
jgi:acetone carboxylase gamma subunit